MNGPASWSYLRMVSPVSSVTVLLCTIVASANPTRCARRSRSVTAARASEDKGGRAAAKGEERATRRGKQDASPRLGCPMRRQ